MVKEVLKQYNDPMIGSYNSCHLSPNGIPNINQRWYSPVYSVYKRLVNLREGQGTDRVTFQEYVHIKSRELWEYYTSL